MNKVILIGRLTDEPAFIEKGETKIGKYTLAVDRKEGADFINCVAFNKGAEFVQKHLHKGTKIAVTGRIQTGSYKNRDGVNVKTFDMVVDSHEFCEKRQEEPEPAGKFTEPPEDFFNPFE